MALDWSVSWTISEKPKKKQKYFSENSSLTMPILFSSQKVKNLSKITNKNVGITICITYLHKHKNGNLHIHQLKYLLVTRNGHKYRFRFWNFLSQQIVTHADTPCSRYIFHCSTWGILVDLVEFCNPFDFHRNQHPVQRIAHHSTFDLLDL